MKIIPVIDIKDGLVVAAQQGKRDAYQPIKSKLCQSSLIENILQSFLSIYPFKTIYIADLNAITHTGNNQQLIDKVISENPSIEFWVDNGGELQDLSATKYRPVIGSESQNTQNFQHNMTPLNNSVLSLDFFYATGYKGPIELLENSVLWPQDIIIMCLDKVGQNSGPDIEKLESFQIKHPEKNFIAAGGIRNKEDLVCLKNVGIKQVLIASALHSGVINTEVIKSL